MAQIKTGISILLLRQLLFEKERIGKVMEVLKKEGLPDRPLNRTAPSYTPKPSTSTATSTNP